MNRAQKGDTWPVGEATVLKGHKSIRDIVSNVLIFAPGRFKLMRFIISGVKIPAQILSARLEILES